jgi:hypothetical protein
MFIYIHVNTLSVDMLFMLNIINSLVMTYECLKMSLSPADYLCN